MDATLSQKYGKIQTSFYGLTRLNTQGDVH